MTTIQQAIELVKSFPKNKDDNKFFSLHKTLDTRLNDIVVLLSEFDAKKYAPETPKEAEERLKIVDKLKKKLKTLVEKNKKTSGLTVLADQINMIIEENLKYYSSGKQFIYWRGPDSLSNQPPGIAILCNDSRSKNNRLSGDFPMDFRDRVIETLNYIALTKTGCVLLKNILQLLNGNKEFSVEIFPNTLKQGNRAIPHSSSDSVQLAVLEIAKGSPGKETKKALELAAQSENLDEQYLWLANKINEMPYFTLQDKPEFYKYHKPLTVVDIENWFKSGYDFLFTNFELDDPVQIMCATAAALYPFSKPNKGSGTTIRWNAFAEYPRNQERPPAIGLAHELIHAFHNLLGNEPGIEQDDTTVVFEYLAVGLGPWDGADLTENMIREEWKDIVGKIPAKDVVNCKIPDKRTQYGEVKPSETSEKLINQIA